MVKYVPLTPGILLHTKHPSTPGNNMYIMYCQHSVLTKFDTEYFILISSIL